MEDATTPVRLIYIAGAPRSGSTLLDLLLSRACGSQPVGELWKLWWTGFERNHRCACGALFQECCFWSDITQELQEKLPDTDLARLREIQSRYSRVRNLPRLLDTNSSLQRQGDYQLYRRALSLLYSALARRSPGGVVIDSSKSPIYLATLTTLSQVEINVIHLIRDSRATAFSWQRRKKLFKTPNPDQLMTRYTPGHASKNWVMNNALVHWVQRHTHQQLTLRYEELVEEPVETLNQLLDTFSLPRAHQDLQSLLNPLEPASHMVDGNPLRFTRAPLQVRPDLEWTRHMSSTTRGKITLLTWPLLWAYGYPLRHRRTLST